MSGFLDAVFSGSPIPVLEKTVRFSEARHRYLLANIANADTPGYRRRDLSTETFDKKLRRMISGQSGRGARFRFDDAAGIRESRGLAMRTRIVSDAGRDSLSGVLRHDGNNVDIEREMATLVRNAGRGRRAATLLKKLLGQIRAVVSED